MIRAESILDLATVGSRQGHAEALAGSVELARVAEGAGYRRIWYAEHHNMPRIASSAPAVLIAAIAARTERILLGAGGVMLPNHAPLTVAEQFGTLANLYPGRIELGLGRAPGTDQATLRALRRDARAAETFPEDVRELRGYLGEESAVPGIHAIPGRGTHVPLYILGSSLFGAHLAAELGLPYAFASHFAPAALHQAIAAYRENFRPSAQLAEPRAFATMNVVAAADAAEAERQLHHVRRGLVRSMLSRGRRLTEEEVDLLLDSPAGRRVGEMFGIVAVGDPDRVREQIGAFGRESGADELILVHQATRLPDRLASVELTAAALGLSG
ncbi:alkane 1-monooxygenase [Corynebacterium sphenisci DSM 44792]|uniref:Alkane 1-monooxygenase n=1 Tax=Corynebacterium sphenisci DSM 44792 TaxID=1437874 RepID=A0A1L7CVC0_9CORY|nr:LLM class flavin-dependent oxidoreductase [Corynebacterium sphenisci]APT89816.1 alkane 1-monooxygenase [Corynebacterium sphenisci DSM 44792]